MHVLRTSLFYITMIGFGAAVVASTQVVEVTGPSGLRDRVVSVLGAAREQFGLGTETAESPTPAEGPWTTVEQQQSAPLPFDRPEATPPVVSETCKGRSGFADPVVIGDTLRLRFFEKAMAAVLPGDTASRTAERDIVFERLDLSGTYDVASDGTISLPMLGRVLVAAADLTCAEAVTKLAYFSATQTQVLVNATFHARPQVLVKGAVRAPGSYGFTPGVTVARLLAASGALGDAAVDAAPTQTGLVMRRNDLVNLQAQALGLQLTRKRLEASLDRSPEIELTPKEREQIIQLLGPDRLAAESAALQADLAETAILATQKQDELSDLAARVADLESQYDLAGEQLDQLERRRDELQDFKERGFVLAQQLDGTVFNIMVSERFQRGIMASLLELQAAQRQARKSLSMAQAQRQRDLTLQIRDIVESGNLLEAQIRTVRADLALLEARSDGPDGAPTLDVVIDRQTETGSISLAAEASTRLMPGDLVTVSILAASATAGTAQRVSGLGGLLIPIGATVKE